MNRQPLNVELLTLDDGTQKIAWDVKQLQSLLGISDLLHQEESSSTASTGVNSSGIPTIETVIAILDELGLKDLYEVRYRKQYATIIPKTDSKRPKVAMYVVQQQSELALSIHDKIWTNHIARFHWTITIYNEVFGINEDADSYFKKLYIPPSEKPEFFGRIIELSEKINVNLSDFEEHTYSTSKFYNLPSFDYNPLILDMTAQDICYEISSDQRFPSTSRISLSQHLEIKNLIQDLINNIEIFLRSNGDKPEIQIDDEQSEDSAIDDDF
ncbi:MULTISPECIES: hypothetical protein [Pseudanabaena]|uniref:Uncharacterized protein n=1 Tax=Pseudanabaena catenata USMAC16 TaxID=1855837 RepID=A0A9X4MFS0_9CYAN|nr:MULTISPECIES: hypothetical protein [Pseudanabaena]MDG3495309.1 hypothetical protein [Pseudanabaena catenata USMAC16]